MNPCTHGIAAPEPCYWCALFTPSTSSRSDANDQSSLAPLLSLEDRTFVALSARGDRRIAEVIERAIRAEMSYRAMSDEEFVGALEAEVFGDDAGLPAAAPQEPLAHDGSPSARGTVRQ